VKKLSVLIVVLCVGCVCRSEVTYDFKGAGSTFDGTNQVQVALTDGDINFNMTVSSTGGDLNSNADYLGVGDDSLDGTTESIIISFDAPVDFISMDLGLVGGSATDGAEFSIGAFGPIDLYTGAPSSSEFNGTSDVYTPASVIRLSEGVIILTGSSDTSNFAIQQMTFSAVPEPAMVPVIALASALIFLIRRRLH
jgi:hypothetical protein